MIFYMKNFLKMPKSKAVYFKAEGRLSDEMIKRCGIKFVFDYEEWEEGTCFVFESNIYETSVDLMRQLVSSNEEKNKYCFVLAIAFVIPPQKSMWLSFNMIIS